MHQSVALINILLQHLNQSFENSEISLSTVHYIKQVKSNLRHWRYAYNAFLNLFTDYLVPQFTEEIESFIERFCTFEFNVFNINHLFLNQITRSIIYLLR
jgi:hypothetical protein